MPTRPPLDWIALNLLLGSSPRVVARALKRFDDPREIAFRLPVDTLMGAYRVPVAGTRDRILRVRRHLARQAEHELKLAGRLGVRVLTLDASDYPAELRMLDDRPPVVYVRGRLEPGRVRLAVVGSRRATLYGKRVAAGLGSGLAARGIEVVSGGARGIDTCTHHGALEEGGRTVAVLGSGLARAYPTENAALFERIAASGALVSELPLELGPKPEHFPRRNRLISALSAAVVVVEAARRSGSLITATHALDQGKEVLAVPGPVSSERSVGCHRLIQDGAKLVQHVDDIVRELSPMYLGALPEAQVETRPAGPGAKPAARTTDEKVVLEMLDTVETTHIDALAERAPFGIARLQAALFGLQLCGEVEVLTGGHYRRLNAC